MTWGLAAELLTRVFTTAAIVVIITLAVEYLGPKIGGALAGLPIVIGPAFFFLLRDHSVSFNADAAASSLMSLSATQAFLLGYIAFAARSRAAIFAATLAWMVSVWALSWLPPSPWLGLLIFLSAMCVARRCSRRFVRPLMLGRARRRLGLLSIQALAAGLLVASVTVASWRLGAEWAGYLVAYPISLTVISTAVHHHSGADLAVLTLRAIMTGLASLAAFTFVLALLLAPLGPVFAFVVALLAGVGVTIALIIAPSRASVA